MFSGGPSLVAPSAPVVPTFTFGGVAPITSSSSLGLPRGLNPKKEYADSDSFAKQRKRRWCYTQQMGFGEIIAGTKDEREEARAREIAATLTAPALMLPPAIVLPAPAIPIAPPLAPSALIAPSPSKAADAEPSPSVVSPSSSTFPSGSTHFFKSLKAFASSPSPSPPPPVSTSHIPPSCVDTHVAVHLLPHYTWPSPQTILLSSEPLPLPNPPTVLYTARSNTFSQIRLRVHSFFDYSSLIPKDKSSPDDKSVSGLAETLGKELRARKERQDAEKALKDRAAQSPEEAAKVEAEIKAKAEKEKQEASEKKRLEERRAGRTKPTGPPPQSTILTVSVSESIRGLVQQLMDFYSDYDVELDPDAIRLVSNGKEITRNDLPEIEVTVLPSASGTPSLPASSDDSTGTNSGFGFGSSGKRAPTKSSASSPLSKDQIASATRQLRETIWNRMNPGAISEMGGTAALKNMTQTDRDRYFRSHTMLAECGLTRSPNQQAISSSSSSSSSSTSSTDPPIFDLFLVYDELSRFTLDTASCLPDVVITSDLLGATMVHSDNKWISLRASKSFTTGRHSWKVKLDQCTGGNIFLGVCNAAMKLNNYIGHDSNGWGYYGCGNIYRTGSSSSYGSSYRTGDVITCLLDGDKHTLAFEKNGTNLGVAFTDLPDTVYPAFSLYSKNDHLQLTEFGTF